MTQPVGNYTQLPISPHSAVISVQNILGMYLFKYTALLLDKRETLCQQCNELFTKIRIIHNKENR